jgi:TRAP-type C4-dicarboxylate transport system substrate-binding protein
MSLTRRNLIQGAAISAAAAAAPLVRSYALEPEFKYKFATNVPITHPVNIRGKQAADEETGGRLDIELFPSGQLGSDTDMLSQLRSGGIEFYTLSGLILSTLVPNASLCGVGFAFPDYAAVWRGLQLASHGRLPRQAPQGRLLQRVEGQVRCGGVVRSRTLYRQAGLRSGT